MQRRYAWQSYVLRIERERSLFMQNSLALKEIKQLHQNRGTYTNNKIKTTKHVESARVAL